MSFVRQAGRNVNVPMQKDGKLLYCAVLVHNENGKCRTEEIFTHANSVGEARWNVAHTIDDFRKTSIVGIGPAVGVFTEDDHGDKLSL